MTSMYDTIMELPLFKGIGEEQLSSMLEKTKMEFLKFDEGEEIYKPGQKISEIDFILNGRIRNSYALDNFSIVVDEILGKGYLLGALNLFGMVTHAPFTATAMGKVSVMRIEKSQYLNVLHSDRIYILNFMNFLAAAAQKSPELFIKANEPSILRSLKNLAFSIVSRGAETVMVAGADEELALYCGVTIEEFTAWKSHALAHNRIMSNQRGIILKSPHLLK